MIAGKGKILRRIIYLVIVIALWSCDNWGSYDFRVKNDTSHRLELRFQKHGNAYSSYQNQRDTVILLPGEEKLVRTIDAPLNSPAHDCLHQHGLNYMSGIEFDTYVDSVKLDKLLYKPDNWTYVYKSKWQAEYTMIITDELISTP